MRLTQNLLPFAALSSVTSGQNVSGASSASASAASGVVTIDVIETFTTSFTGAQASLGNVTLYVPMPTVVPVNATSGLLRYANTTQTTQTVSATPIIVPAGNISYTISAGAAPTTVPFLGGADRNVLGYGALLGAAAGVAALL